MKLIKIPVDKDKLGYLYLNPIHIVGIELANCDDGVALAIHLVDGTFNRFIFNSFTAGGPVMENILKQIEGI